MKTLKPLGLIVALFSFLPLLSTAAVLRTNPADELTSSGATLRGSIHLNRRPAHVAFQIRTPGKRWVGHTPWQKIARGQTDLDFDAVVAGLQADTDYQYRAIAILGGIRRMTAAMTFHTAPPTADVITQFVANVTTDMAELHATVNASTASGGAAWFEWGTSTELSERTDGIPVTEPQDIVAVLSNLQPATTYYYRAVVTNQAGAAYHEIESFTTGGGAPTATTGGAGNIAGGMAVLNGVVNTRGVETTVLFQFGVGAVDENTVVATNLPAGTNDIAVLGTINGLAPGGAYLFRITATNRAGAASGATQTFNVPCAGNSIAVVTNMNEAELRAAIAAAKTVHFAGDGVINLSRPIHVFCDITLSSEGHTVEINGGHATRLFDVHAGATLTASGLMLADATVHGSNGVPAGVSGTRGESVSGGAIRVVSGRLVALNCTFSSNSVVGGNSGLDLVGPGRTGGDAQGGAIAATESSVMLSNCWFISNRSVGGAGGSYSNSFAARIETLAPGASEGGAISIANSASVLSHCTVLLNSCATASVFPGENTAGGGAVKVLGGSLEIEHSSFYNNWAEGDGGAIHNDASTLHISRSDFERNSALGAGDTSGGAISQSSGALSLTDTIVALNTVRAGDASASVPTAGGTAFGGGVAVTGGIGEFDRCFFGTNNAMGGASSENLGAPFYYLNSGEGVGGGVFCRGAVLATNCTWAGNTASSGAILWSGAVAGDSSAGKGGAMANVGGNLQLFYCTVARNNATVGPSHVNPAAGGGAYNLAGLLALTGTILDFNTVNGTSVQNGFGGLSDQGHNLASDASSDLTSGTSITDENPRLGTLGLYGGFTPGFPLLDGSPAIDGGDAFSAPGVDQFLIRRPLGLAPDIGSTEQ